VNHEEKRHHCDDALPGTEHWALLLLEGASSQVPSVLHEV